MKGNFSIPSFLLVLLIIVVATSCNLEDPGPLQEMKKDFSVVDFDQLEMGSGFRIDVKESQFFSIQAEGDRRNIEDLRVRKQGSTLIIDFSNFRNRTHETYIKITMPSLSSANFSGATHSTLSGFSDGEKMDFILSGASTSQLNINPSILSIRVSGASHLNISGSADSFDADVSGASKLSAFDFNVNDVVVNASGASEAKVKATKLLHATASGASKIIYQGDAVVTSSASGASTVHSY